MMSSQGQALVIKPFCSKSCVQMAQSEAYVQSRCNQIDQATVFLSFLAQDIDRYEGHVIGHPKVTSTFVVWFYLTSITWMYYVVQLLLQSPSDMTVALLSLIGELWCLYGCLTRAVTVDRLMLSAIIAH